MLKRELFTNRTAFVAKMRGCVALVILLVWTGCDKTSSSKIDWNDDNQFRSSSESTSRQQPKTTPSGQQPSADFPTPPGMVWIPGGEFLMGSDHHEARDDEKPVHMVTVSGFYIDVTEVTNADFRKFVNETDYVTVAQRKPKLEDVMAQLPPGTPEPPVESLVPGSLVFHMTDRPVRTDDFSQWWRWTPGADWRHPNGPKSNIEGLDDHPVVHVAWDDAVAYAEWLGKRLPMEAEWEFAARGGHHQQPYIWGSEKVSDQQPQANIWQGQFPFRNTLADQYLTTAPVKSFPPNDFGLYDMAGNVWEWCSDWYRRDTYARRPDNNVVDPVGPDRTDHPLEPRKVQRGGSYLCHRDYCSSYRPSARMSTSGGTGLSHLGIRCVMTLEEWKRQMAKAQSKRGGSAGSEN